MGAVIVFCTFVICVFLHKTGQLLESILELLEDMADDDAEWRKHNKWNPVIE